MHGPEAGPSIKSYAGMQRSLCLELVSRLQRHSAALVRATAFAAELDCLVALACGARDFNLCRPELTPDDVLHIKAGTACPCLLSSGQLTSCAFLDCGPRLLNAMQSASLLGCSLTAAARMPGCRRRAVCMACCKAISLAAGLSFGMHAGRHLLVEQVVDTCIPNNLDVESHASRIHVRTCSSCL